MTEKKYPGIYPHEISKEGKDRACVSKYFMGDQEHRDGKLVVEARNALPGLLEHIDRLTRRLEIAEARLGRVARNHPEAYEQALAGDDQ